MRYTWLFCFLVFALSVKGQQNWSLIVNTVDQSLLAQKELRLPKTVADSVAAIAMANKILGQIQAKGYFLAEIQHIVFQNKQVVVNIRCGEAFRWLNLRFGNIPAKDLNPLKINPTAFSNSRLDIQKLDALFQTILSYYENNGFPFASVGLDSISLEKQEITAAIKVENYQQITYDSLKVVGTAQISSNFLQQFLAIRPGQAYRECDLTKIDNKLKELTFLQQSQGTEVRFANQMAGILIYADKKNANQFDGILGFQQNNLNGKLALVGDLKLHLNNIFQRAERLDLDYKGLTQGSQQLQLGAKIPNLFNTNFGVEPNFHLLKQDSAYLNLDAKINIQYAWRYQHEFSLYFENKNTNLISTNAYQNAQALPPYLDANTQYYGIGLNLTKIDYIPNPQKGYGLSADIAIGNRKIKKNAGIPTQLYQNVPLLSTSYRFFVKNDWYFPLLKQTVAAINLQSAFLNNKRTLENEAFRLGGQKILRGFNELSILANAYLYYNAELRYLLDKNSFLALFVNQAYLKYTSSSQNYYDHPLGFGAGINLETNVGILSLSYALGKQRNIPVNLQRGKIHFGISASF
jgi:outer membrane protein assembly factor BamA